MQSALTRLDGIEAADVDINYDTKIVKVDTAGTPLALPDLVKAFEGTQYGIVGGH